jgi:hypothetical protein
VPAVRRTADHRSATWPVEEPGGFVAAGLRGRLIEAVTPACVADLTAARDTRGNISPTVLESVIRGTIREIEQPS